MAQIKQIKQSVILVYEASESTGETTIQEWTQNERIKRSLKTLALGWGLAAVAILIPLLHFVLVPFFLVVSVIFAFFIYQQTSTILGGHGECPKCHKPFRIEKGPEKWPQHDTCSECFAAILIKKK